MKYEIEIDPQRFIEAAIDEVAEEDRVLSMVYHCLRYAARRIPTNDRHSFWKHIQRETTDNLEEKAPVKKTHCWSIKDHIDAACDRIDVEDHDFAMQWITYFLEQIDNAYIYDAGIEAVRDIVNERLERGGW